MDHTHHKLTLANKVTICRILLVPLFILTLIYYVSGVKEDNPNHYLRWGAVVIFLTAALTDALDGFLARSRGEKTVLGTYLDPIADKALLLSGLIILGMPSAGAFNLRIPIWYLLLIISRDAVLIIGAVLINFLVGKVTVRPRLVGKISTVCQMLLIIWVLLGRGQQAFDWFLWTAGATTLISAILYYYDGIRQLGKAEHHNKTAK